MPIEQAVYGNQDAGGYQFLARSSGFRDEWLAPAQALCTGFGERPADASCPAALFALPLDAQHVAVVQVADQGHDSSGRPGALAFRLLVLPRRQYENLGGDPFWIGDALPPDWSARGELPPLEWTKGPPQQRTVAQLQRVLDVSDDRCAWLLGAAQVLVDGGRVVVERHAPDPELVRDLWALLPWSSRAAFWPATFAFGNAHGFHVAVVPAARGPEYTGYVPEGQAGEYPEGRYELALQTAVEQGNQEELDRLLARRSRGQMVWLAVALLLIFALVPLVARLPIVPPPEGPAPKNGQPEELKLPPAERERPLDAGERKELQSRLEALLVRLGGEGEATPAALDRAIDRRLGEKKPARDPGDLAKREPAAQGLRALLWKHGVKEYDEPRLNGIELLERLETVLIRKGVLKEQKP